MSTSGTCCISKPRVPLLLPCAGSPAFCSAIPFLPPVLFLSALPLAQALAKLPHRSHPFHHWHSPLCQRGVWSSHKPARSCTATSRAGSGLRTPWTSDPSAPGCLTSGSEQCWWAGAGNPPGVGPSPSSAVWSTTHSSGLGIRHEGPGLSPSQQAWHGAEHPAGMAGERSPRSSWLDILGMG